MKNSLNHIVIEIKNQPGKDSDTENAENEPDLTKIDGRNAFISSGTGKSLSEALIFASTNPQYDNRLFIELQVQ